MSKSTCSQEAEKQPRQVGVDLWPVLGFMFCCSVRVHLEKRYLPKEYIFSNQQRSSWLTKLEVLCFLVSCQIFSSFCVIVIAVRLNVSRAIHLNSLLGESRVTNLDGRVSRTEL